MHENWNIKEKKMKNFLNNMKLYFVKNWVDIILFGIGIILWKCFVSSKIIFINYEILPTDSIISSFIVPSFIGLMALIITITVLFYQLYFNRYNLRNFSNQIFPIFLSLGIYVILGLIFLCLYFFYNSNFTKYLCCYTFLAFVIRFIIFIVLFNRLTLSYFIRTIGKKKTKILNKGNCSYDEIKEIFEDLTSYFNESVEKKESHYIDIVINVISDVYDLYLRNSSNISCKTPIEEKKKIDEYLASQLSQNFFIIINAHVMGTVIDNYIEFLLNYSEKCLLAERNYFFNQMLDQFAVYYVNNKITERDSIYLCRYSFNIYKKAMEISNDAILENIEDFYINTMFLSDYTFEKDSSKYDIFMNLSNMLSSLIKKKKYKQYTNLLSKVSCIITSELNNIDFLYAKTFFILVRTQYRIYCEEKDIRTSFENFLFDQTKFAIYIGNDTLIKQLGLLYSDIQSKDFVSKSVFENSLSLYYRSCRKNQDNAFYFIPDFKNLTKSLFTVSETLELFNELIQMAIEINNEGLVSTILEDLIDNILKLDEIPTSFIDSFENYLLFILDNKNEDLLYIVMNKYLDFIKELHDNKKINDDIMKSIFDVWESVCNIIDDINQVSMQKLVLSKLTNFDEYIDNLNTNHKQHILLILLHSAISAIESNNDDLMRICSNQIGWIVKKAIDNKDNETYKKGIDTAVKLFNLASEVGISDIFLSFESTIFILLGSLLFLRKEQENLKYLHDSIATLKYKGERKPILVGRHLREFEADYWKNFFDDENDIEKLIDEYYKYFKDYMDSGVQKAIEY